MHRSLGPNFLGSVEPSRLRHSEGCPGSHGNALLLARRGWRRTLLVVPGTLRYIREKLLFCRGNAYEARSPYLIRPFGTVPSVRLIGPTMNSALVTCWNLAFLWLAQTPCTGGVDGTYSESQRLSCGVRAAWSFARCCGVRVDYSDIERQFTVGKYGVSLADVARVLEQSGFSCSVRRMSPSDLTNRICPAVVHLRPEDDRNSMGHYAVVVEIDDRGLTVIEPTVGVRQRWPWRYFSDRWTGYCVMGSAASNWEQRFTGLLWMLGSGTLLCLYFGWLSGSGSWTR
jgi:hypothetical protein